MSQPPYQQYPPPQGGWPPAGGPPPGGWPQGPAPGYPPPKKSSSALLIAVLIVGGLFGCGIMSSLAVFGFRRYMDRARQADQLHPSVDSSEPEVEAKPLDSGTLVKSSDGHSSLSVPSSWQTHLQIHATAGIQAGDPSNVRYVVVISEPKADFVSSMTLEGYADIVFGQMQKAVTGFEKTPAHNLRIGGRPAVQYEVRGSVDQLNLVYLVTFVDGPSKYHQISAWTSKSKYPDSQAEFRRISGTFREL